MASILGDLKFYTVEEICKKFKMSPHTLYGYIKTGKIPAKRFGKNYQISEATLKDFLMNPTLLSTRQTQENILSLRTTPQN
ncbi:MAG: helix-turn-helix domain-containing protein [Elusimicrobia bacterium]|nr:helix-turn-helix domain-containing protein [Elusimicrobiota bacterium]